MSRVIAFVSLFICACSIEGQTRLTAYVYDYSHLQPDLIKRAEAVATKVLGDAGVAAEWRNCGEADDCKGTLEPMEIVVCFEPEARAGLAGGALGQSLLPGDDVYAAYARVFAGPVVRRAEAASMPSEQLLGYTMSHEIAHLLIGGAHTPFGLMRQRWTKEEEGRIRVGSLRFDKNEAVALRSRMFERLATARGATAVAGVVK